MEKIFFIFENQIQPQIELLENEEDYKKYHLLHLNIFHLSPKYQKSFFNLKKETINIYAQMFNDLDDIKRSQKALYLDIIVQGFISGWITNPYISLKHTYDYAKITEKIIKHYKK